MGDCIAVGAAGTSAVGNPLTERWNRASWAIEPSPVVADTSDAFLLSVSSLSAGRCMAAGTFSQGGLGNQPLMEQRSGWGWAITPAATPPTGGGYMNSVSCTSSTDCTAAGTLMPADKLAGLGSLAERWNGTSWSVEPTPRPAAGFGFQGVSCAAAACMAVGGFPASPVRPLAELRR